MSVRGDVTVECDSVSCRAELVLPAADLWTEKRTLIQVAVAEGWKYYPLSEDIACPDCVEEAKQGG